MELTHEDLIANVPIEIDGVGHIKSPYLHNIWEIKYKTYELMCNYLNVDFDRYLELTKFDKPYNNLTEDKKNLISFYFLIINNAEFLYMYKEIFSLCFIENIDFDFNKQEFIVWELEKSSNKKHIIGSINNNNFEDIRDCLLKINCIRRIEKPDEPTIKYKNETARKLAERMEKAKAKEENKKKIFLSFGKMVSKYCAVNKNGINMLNVHQLTVYQFYDQWIELNNLRQCDIQDNIYANSVSFSDVNSYDSELWLK